MSMLLLLLLVAVPSTSQLVDLTGNRLPVQEMRPPSGWYVLVRATSWSSQGWIDNLRQSSPQAVGPYPSEEMCRLAARVLMPDDRQFWPAAEKVAADLKEKEAAALRAIQRDAELAEIQTRPLAQRRNKTFWLADGTGLKFDKTGKEIDGTERLVTVRGVVFRPSYIAVSGCLQVLGDNQS